jgi:hypothetical protein
MLADQNRTDKPGSKYSEKDGISVPPLAAVRLSVGMMQEAKNTEENDRGQNEERGER